MQKGSCLVGCFCLLLFHYSIVLLGEWSSGNKTYCIKVVNMSKCADVTLISSDPNQNNCCFKLGNLPVGIYRSRDYGPITNCRTTSSDWFVGRFEYLRPGDAMILIWYDGISCFIQSNEGFTVRVNSELDNKKHKINISDGDTIRVTDWWNVRNGEICLKVHIFYVPDNMTFEAGKNMSDIREQNIPYNPVPQNQILPVQPRQNMGHWSELTSTDQKLDLENQLLKKTLPKTENVILQRGLKDVAVCRDIHNNISFGHVAKMKNVFEPNEPVESRKEHKIPVKITKASPKYLKSSKTKKDLCVQCSSEQCQDYMHKEKNIITNLRVKSHASQSDSLLFASNVSGNEMREQCGATIQKNTSTGAKSHASQSDSLFVASNDSGNEMREHYGVTNDRNTSNGVNSHASQSHSLSYASNVSGNEIREQYGATNHRNTSKVENITANQNVFLPLASQRDTCDYDMPDEYCEMDQSNTQQEGQLEVDETIIIPKHGGNCDSILLTQQLSEIDNCSCEEQPMKGVSNMGMTCYANGIFQILAQTQLFLSAIKPLVELPKRPLTNSLWKVLEEINHPIQYFTDNRNVVQKLLDVIAKYSSFSSCRQDDCLEFLLHILERLKEENQQSTSMFEMNLQTVIEHETHPGKHVDKCDIQLSYHLLVPFYREQNKDNPTVASCLNKMLNVVESFSGKELPCRYCSRTGALKQRMTKHFVVSRSPDILILQIGRVEHMKFRTYSNLKKKNELVEYEHILDIDEVQWDGCKRMAKRNNYQLYGVVLHAGIIECGHYYCFVKHRKTSEWFYCNDSLVYQIHAGMVLNDTNAYLLFYKRTILEM